MKRRYGRQFLIAVDQLLNAALAGWADETLSARAYRMSIYSTKKRWKVIRCLIDMLFFWEREHCLQSFLSEQKRSHLPVTYRD